MFFFLQNFAWNVWNSYKVKSTRLETDNVLRSVRLAKASSGNDTS